MILLALDPSLTRTGYAVFPAPPVRLSELIAGSFASEDPADFVRQVLLLVDQNRIEFIVSEQARGVILLYNKKELWGSDQALTPNGNQLKLSELQGGLRGLTAAKGIPLALVSPKTWRKAVLGNGNLSRPEAKKAARQHCRLLRIDAKNHDQAEAVCIGLWGATASPEFRLASNEQRRLAL